MVNRAFKNIITIILLFAYGVGYLHSQNENCDNRINISGDTVIYSATNMNISLCAENNALYYVWSNGDTTKCSDFVLNPDTNNQITLRTFHYSVDTNIIYNGDFELGNVGFFSDLPVSYNWYGNWYDVTAGTNEANNDFADCYADGNVYVADPATSLEYVVFYQNIVVEPSSYYEISYQVVNLGDDPNKMSYQYRNKFIVKIDGIDIGFIDTVPIPACEWKTVKHIWYNSSSTSCSFSLNNINVSNYGNDFGLDNISLKKLCVADDTVNIRIQYPIAENDTIKVSICENELPFLFRNTEYTSAGDYSVEDDDTTFVLQLSVNQIYSDTINADICFGEIYLDDNFNESTTGTYTKNFTSINNCDSIIVLNLNVHDIYVLNIEDTIYKGEVFNRYGLILSDSGEYTVKYRLNAEDFCPTTINLILHVIERPEIEVYFPNAFTPSLSTNNVFRYYVDENEIYFLRFEIFDRWGTKVFYSEKIGEYWDGTYKGKPCDMSTFAYKFLYSPKYDKNTVKELSGEFLLLR